jgi:Xaa-Pro aminopeptidase
MNRLDRITRLRKIMEESELDSVIISDPANIFYLSGFTSGDDGKLIITDTEQFLFTDPRYEIQAKEECCGFDLLIDSMDNPMKEQFKDILKKCKLKAMGFEGSDMSFQQVQTLRTFKHGLNCKLVNISPGLEWFRSIKDDEELKIMKVAATIGRESFIIIRHLIKAGAIEQNLAAELEYEFRKKGASGVSFPTIIAAGPNSAKAHYSAGSRILKKGDMVVCDFGCKYEKYSSDETNTVSIGKPSEAVAEIYEIVRDAHMEAVSKTKCGMTSPEIDNFARDHIKKCGYDKYFNHSTGHSLGLGTYENGTFHEKPSIGPREDKTPIVENMVITVEPGIYIESFGGVRIEAEYVMTNNGLEQMIDYGDRGLDIL